MRISTQIFVTSVIAALSLGMGHFVLAQTPAVGTPSPEAFKAPIISPDTEIFKRTPILDGTIDGGEWDGFYTFSAGDWNANTYVDWDDANLYFAALSSKPVDLMVLIDANGDGWFHGEENYELLATRNSDGTLSKQVFKYESKNSASALASPVSPAEASLWEVKSSMSGAINMIEIRVLKRVISDLVLAKGRKIGFQIAIKTDSGDTGWVPARVSGETKECATCTLVTKKFVSLSPLVLGFDLDESRVTQGESISGRFHITNGGNTTVDVRSFVIAGEGKAGEFLNSQKVRLDGLTAKKHIAQDAYTNIPQDMRTGSWAMGAEVRSLDSKLGAALISFDIVDPFDATMVMPSGTVPLTVKDVTIAIDVKNNMRKDILGKVKLTMPIGWEFRKKTDTKSFNVLGGRTYSKGILFTVKPPLGASGEIPVKAEITVGELRKTLEKSFKLGQ